MYIPKTFKKRLAYLRAEIEAERISTGELLELQDLAEYIDPSDTLLLEWAGCCEGCGKPITPDQSQADGRHSACI